MNEWQRNIQIIKNIFQQVEIEPYESSMHSALLEDAEFAIWQKSEDDPCIHTSSMIDLLSHFYDLLDGLEYYFLNQMDAIFKATKNELGYPMFVYKNKWIGVITCSDKGIRLLCDYTRSTSLERAGVIGYFNGLVHASRIQLAKLVELKAQTCSREYWQNLLELNSIYKQNNAKVESMGRLYLSDQI
jgi:hypothetical protein